MTPQPDEDGIVWENLSSSHIDAFAELKADQAILIRYSNGSVYRFPANAEEAAGLRNSISPGRYMALMFGKGGTRVS